MDSAGGQCTGTVNADNVSTDVVERAATRNGSSALACVINSPSAKTAGISTANGIQTAAIYLGGCPKSRPGLGSLDFRV